MSQREKVIVFFDQNCLLCSRSVRILHHLDARDHLHFAALQGKTARTFEGLLPDSGELDSAITVRLVDGQVEVFRYSEAVRVALRSSAGVGAVLALLLRLVPLPWRDAAYRWLAGKRFVWFEKTDACKLLAPELRKKLLG